MSDKRARVSGRRNSYEGPFAALPHAYFKTAEYARLSFRARALLIELALQFFGSNNGGLTATYSTMRGRGFKSKDQLTKAIDELLARGWIQVSRQGGRTRATLYALTYRRIDQARPDLDVRPGPPSNLWRDDQSHWREGFRREPRESKRGFATVKTGRETSKIVPRATGDINPSDGASLARVPD